jgi:ABC-2 type transport system ATP-binding protein
MPDSVGFYDNMTALENLMYIGELNGIPQSEVRERALEMMSVVGLRDNDIHKKTSAYSRGMKQRLGLADVLIKQPEVIILDEPTLGIDPSGVRDFLTLIHQLSRQQGLTVLLSSHHLHQVQQVCDRVGIFVGGQLLAEGNIDHLSRNLFAEDAFVVTISVKDSLSPDWKGKQGLLNLDAVKKVTIQENTIEISCTENCTPELVRFFVKNELDVMSVQKKAYGLEEIYQRYFENNLNENETSMTKFSLWRKCK